MQRSLNLRLKLYEFEPGHNVAEATKKTFVVQKVKLRSITI